MIQRIKCFFGKHNYRIWYEQRQWRYKKGNKHIRIEFRYTCKCCGKSTKWMRLSKLEDFNKSIGRNDA